MSLNIPGHEHFISAISRDCANLTVRLVSGHDADSESGAIELRIDSTVRLEPIADYLNQVQERDDYLYAFERGEKVVMSDEGGAEIEIDIKAVHCKLDGLNREELGNALVQSRSWYEQEHQSHRRTATRLQQARELAQEQLRRLETKTKNHDENSPAGVLYSQHMKFLERLLRATEA